MSNTHHQTPGVVNLVMPERFTFEAESKDQYTVLTKTHDLPTLAALATQMRDFLRGVGFHYVADVAIIGDDGTEHVSDAED